MVSLPNKLQLVPRPAAACPVPVAIEPVKPAPSVKPPTEEPAIFLRVIVWKADQHHAVTILVKESTTVAQLRASIALSVGCQASSVSITDTAPFYDIGDLRMSRALRELNGRFNGDVRATIDRGDAAWQIQSTPELRISRWNSVDDHIALSGISSRAQAIQQLGPVPTNHT